MPNPTFESQYLNAPGLQYHANMLSALAGLGNVNSETVMNNLTSAATAITNAGPGINAALTNQNQVLGILTSETDRLNTKRDSINNAVQGQNRILTLNESYRARYADYVSILVIFTTCFFIIIALSILSNAYPIIPGVIVTIITIIVILVGFYMGYSKYLDIYARDQINYNELNIPPPVILSAAEIAEKQQAALNSGNLLGGMNIGTCMGQLCCAEGTVWNAESSTCTLPVTPFTTMNGEAFSGKINLLPQQITGNLSISPNSPNEFSQYSIL
jgi:hypothetical protein